MLVVAIPKSASTALAATLGDAHGLPHRQRVFPGNPWPSGFSALARWHSDIRQLEHEQVESFAAKNMFFKQHVPPTRHNLKLLAGHPKVILLRDPSEVVRAYRRAHIAGLRHSKRREFIGLEEDPEEAWIERARVVGMLGDLRRFVKVWRRARNALHVDYEAVVNDTDRAFNEIEDYFGLARSKRPVTLRKERYSGASATP